MLAGYVKQIEPIHPNHLEQLLQTLPEDITHLKVRLFNYDPFSAMNTQLIDDQVGIKLRPEVETVYSIDSPNREQLMAIYRRDYEIKKSLSSGEVLDPPFDPLARRVEFHEAEWFLRQAIMRRTERTDDGTCRRCTNSEVYVTLSPFQLTLKSFEGGNPLLNPVVQKLLEAVEGTYLRYTVEGEG